ncbi:MAG: hypothetical protein IJ080_02515 [Oscillospiraceae bacterium]|nr:hypothetical protein [Oscillospiraceae bacterium]
MRFLANDKDSRLFAGDFSLIRYDMRTRAALIETDKCIYLAPGLSASQTDDIIRAAYITGQADLTPYGKVYTDEEYSLTVNGLY